MSLNKTPKCTTYVKNDVALISEKEGGESWDPITQPRNFATAGKNNKGFVSVDIGLYKSRVPGRMAPTSFVVAPRIWKAYTVNYCVLGTFAKLRRAAIRLRHVCLSAWNKSALTERILMKFDI